MKNNLVQVILIIEGIEFSYIDSVFAQDFLRNDECCILFDLYRTLRFEFDATTTRPRLRKTPSGRPQWSTPEVHVEFEMERSLPIVVDRHHVILHIELALLFVFIQSLKMGPYFNKLVVV